MACTSSTSFFLPAAAYNNIQTFEELRYQPGPEVLQQAAQIFIHHGMQLHYGLCLRHRHLRLPHDTVMVHSQYADGETICRPRFVSALDPSTIFPHSLFLDGQTDSKPYEYTTNPPQSALDLHFIHDLKQFLRKKRVHEYLALWAIPTEPQNFILDEYMLKDGRGTVYLPRNLDQELVEESMVTTAWSFRRCDDGSSTYIIKRGCEKKGGGRHENKPDQ